MLRFLPRWALLSAEIVSRQAIGTALLVLVVGDLALGGNGYLIKVGPFRVRELLFILCMVWTVAALVSRKEARPAPQVWWLFGAFVATTAFGVLIGFLNDNFSAGIAMNVGPVVMVDPSPRAAFVGELKPLTYFAMLLFFVTAIRSRREVTMVVTILMVAGAALATIYLLALASVHSGLVPYSTLYGHLRGSDEIIFRVNPYVGFLYKGMYYACVAALLLLLDPFRMTKLMGTVAVVAVALTLTRSLSVALGVCIIAAMPGGRWWQRMQLAGQVLLLMVVTSVGLGIESNFLQAPLSRPIRTEVQEWRDKDPPAAGPAIELVRPTDSIRRSDIGLVRENMTLTTLAIGHGFAAKIGQRTKIELTYLEILYKQGVVGLAFWFALLAYICWLYLRVPDVNKTLGRALLLCALFFFISTATNTVLTGSIGLGTVFIVLACLSVLANEPERVAWYGRPTKPLVGKSLTS
ncbi:hypothetical protein IVB38_17165 [Bradyrhizobium sp. 38]|uniref:hypothetical protein n=1 Tax=unclassified Bradyrhizobium TaxID=2631580 RepID=UPI001FF80F1E|nr:MULTISPECIES: hypothetical protein [unclassified Bradyrhizobium]MCK1337710.1 hypothetical protein [Bradyrhizobium sp. 38]MCK1781867.1 hypothetical protein [Bradyrhizobium sp. 132]